MVFDVEAKAQVVHMPEEIRPQREHHFFPDVSEHAVADVPDEHAGDDRGKEVCRDEPGQAVPALGLADAGGQDDVVDQVFGGQVLEGNGHAVHGVEDQGGGYQTTVWLDVGPEKSPKPWV